ncbi:MAG: BatD family protein, partial [Planctomycetes bacterium]|nr:BatD family protein [Planctomycetota bacterium]
MRFVWLAMILFSCPGASAPAQELSATAEQSLFFEVLTERDAYFVQEPIRVTIRLGFDARFFEDHAIQLFHRHLDLPVQVRAPWIEDLPGTIVLESTAEKPGSRDGQDLWSFALNDRVVQAVRVDDRAEGKREFFVLEIERSFLPTREGALKIPVSDLSFAFTARFEDNLFSGPVPQDRHDLVKEGAGRLLEIIPLPDKDRPADFTGAVGRFSIREEADPKELTLGNSLKLVLHIEGEGNLGFFDPPRLDRLDGFHLYGCIDNQDPMQRTLVYDLAPLGETIREIPPVSLVYFDPHPSAEYRRIWTRPIPIKVHPLPEGTSLRLLAEEGRPIPGLTDLYGPKSISASKSGDSSARVSAGWLGFTLIGPWVLALGLLVWRRGRERDLRDPLGVRARGAIAAFRASLKKPD